MGGFISYFRVAPSAVYRMISSELVVIQMDTGFFYHFSHASKQFLDFFKEAASVPLFCNAVGVTETEEVDYLIKFCRLLSDAKILESAEKTDRTFIKPKGIYERPEFLRKGEKKLDEIAFLSP